MQSTPDLGGSDSGEGPAAASSRSREAERVVPRIQVNGARNGVVTQAGGALLTATIRALGLDAALSAVLARWRKPLAIHDPAKVLLDLAVALGLGGDCLADNAVVRAEAAVFGLVASDPTVSRPAGCCRCRAVPELTQTPATGLTMGGCRLPELLAGCHPTDRPGSSRPG